MPSAPDEHGPAPADRPCTVARLLLVRRPAARRVERGHAAPRSAAPDATSAVHDDSGNGDAVSGGVSPPGTTACRLVTNLGDDAVRPGAAVQRTPAASVQLESDPVSKSAEPNDALVAIGPLASDAGSNT